MLVKGFISGVELRALVHGLLLDNIAMPTTSDLSLTRAQQMFSVL